MSSRRPSSFAFAALVAVGCAPTAGLSGVVLDDDTGAPLAHQHVAWVPTGASPYGVPSVVTDDTGAFFFDTSGERGELVVTPNRPDDDHVERTLALDSGSGIVDVELRAGRGRDYDGIGLILSHDGQHIVDTVIAGSPAAEAGIEPGLVLVRADGSDVDDSADDYLSAMLRGPNGSDVALRFQDPADPALTHDVDIERRTISLPEEPPLENDDDNDEADAALLFAAATAAPALACDNGVELVERLGTVAANLTRGIALLEVCVKREPRNAHAWNVLGAAYQTVNRRTDAVHAYRAFVALSPTDPEADVVSERIDALAR